MTKELFLIASNQIMGRTQQDKQGNLKLIYEDAWRNSDDSYPLSTSMPLSAKEHSNNIVSPWLTNLLPDNEIIIAKWATRFQVSPRNAFALLSYIGEDCAGAVQFVRPERTDDILKAKKGDIEWLEEKEVAERIAILRQDQSAWRKPEDSGQFSLAGVQPKIAMYFDGEKWGIPSGYIPTTHILKPPMANLDGHAENEHFCLALARSLGIPSSFSKVIKFDNEVVISVERFDRLKANNEIIRLHQEDMCQAFGIFPHLKYQNEGGLTPEQIADNIRKISSKPDEDVTTFFNALMFNWLIGGTDAHAKNYAFIIASSSQIRLAPLYDVASILPYPSLFDANKIKMAMKVGGKYNLNDVYLRHIEKMADDFKLEFDDVLASVIDMAEKIPEKAKTIAQKMKDKALKNPIIDALQNQLSERSKNCLNILRS